MRTVLLEREVKIVNSESTVRRVHLRAPAAESPLRAMLRARTEVQLAGELQRTPARVQRSQATQRSIHVLCQLRSAACLRN
jgi:hypothetical protein